MSGLNDDLRLPDSLTAAESKLVAAVKAGEVADYSVGKADLDKPDNGRSWGPERTIRAEVIYALATSKSTGVHAKGVQVLGARIRGALDFAGAEIPHPLLLWDCFIPEPIMLRDATAFSVGLDGSRVDGIRADGLHARGNVFLRNGFHATGEVRLPRAKIGGELDCYGSRFENANGPALYADGATVDGHVFLRNGFRATGEVRLVNAKIGGQLSCSGGTFSNPEGIALNLRHASVAATLFLRDLATHPAGAVDLGYAQVGELADDEKSWPNAGELRLDGFVYTRLSGDTPWHALDWKDNAGEHTGRLKWLSLQPDFYPEPYEQLAMVLRDMGHEREAREIEIARRRVLRPGLAFWSRFGDWFLDRTIRYGLKPWRAFVGLIFALVFGWILFWGANRHGMMVPTEKELVANYQKNPSSLPSGYPQFTPLLYDLDSLLPGIDLGQKSQWRLQEKRPADLYSFASVLYYFVWFAFVFYYVVWWVSFSLLGAALTGLLKA